MSLDAGVTWLDLNLGATPPEVRDFDFDPVTNTLFAAAGDGIWSFTFVPPTIGGCPLTPAVMGMSYNASVNATGGVGPYSWGLASGTLPAGITFVPASASFAGTPTEVGSFQFTVGVTDAIGQAGEQSCSLLVAVPLAITSNALPAAVLDVPYTTLLQATGGVAPFTWSLESGTLPAGIGLDQDTGALSGTPTGVGSFTFTVGLSDGSGQNASVELTLAVVGVAEPIPTQTPWGFLALIAAMAVLGVIKLRP